MIDDIQQRFAILADECIDEDTIQTAYSAALRVLADLDRKPRAIYLDVYGGPERVVLEYSETLVLVAEGNALYARRTITDMRDLADIVDVEPHDESGW